MKKLRGFTLVETLMSMIIILTVFAVAMLIVVNIMKSDRHKEQLMAFTLANEVYVNTLCNKTFYNETISSNNLVIEKKFSPFNGSAELLLLQIIILDPNEKILIEKKEIVIDPNK